jgi:hypothetical protein
LVRAVDHNIATGVWPDTTEHGWPVDDWPAIQEKMMAASGRRLLDHRERGRRQAFAR